MYSCLTSEWAMFWLAVGTMILVYVRRLVLLYANTTAHKTKANKSQTKTKLSGHS